MLAVLIVMLVDDDCPSVMTMTTTMVSTAQLGIKGRMWYQPLCPKLVFYVGISASSLIVRDISRGI